MIYLETNCLSIKDTIVKQTTALYNIFVEYEDTYLKIQMLSLVVILIIIVGLTVIKILALQRAKNQNFSMLEIFLDISDIQIQQYTSKSEKFLTSLNAEDLNGEIDVD